MVHLTEKVMNFLLLIKESGGRITKDKQNMYGSVGYYLMIKYLKKNDLINHDGNTETNQKIWKFTQKGEEVSNLLRELRSVLDGKKVEGDTPQQ